jgi:hypothetical protein
MRRKKRGEKPRKPKTAISGSSNIYANRFTDGRFMLNCAFLSLFYFSLHRSRASDPSYRLAYTDCHKDTIKSLEFLLAQSQSS